jgi:hypothetical protein
MGEPEPERRRQVKQRLRRPPGAGIGPKQCPGPKGRSGKTTDQQQRSVDHGVTTPKAEHGLSALIGKVRPGHTGVSKGISRTERKPSAGVSERPGWNDGQSEQCPAQSHCSASGARTDVDVREARRSLTPREHSVITLLFDFGLQNREIATALNANDGVISGDPLIPMDANSRELDSILVT